MGIAMRIKDKTLRYLRTILRVHSPSKEWVNIRIEKE